jgi:hypothetical protein
LVGVAGVEVEEVAEEADFLVRLPVSMEVAKLLASLGACHFHQMEMLFL